MNEAMVHGAVARSRAGAAADPRLDVGPADRRLDVGPTDRRRDGATVPHVDAAAVRSALAEVPDPEIPVVSVVDLGMVEEVRVDRDGIRVTLLPTFVGCPALDVIRTAVEHRLRAFDRPVDVHFDFRVPWTSDRITPDGRDKLHASGFAPPAPSQPGAPLLVQLGTPVPCPNCGSRRTVLENAFGPTQCRAIYYCTGCRQPFESFKPV